MLSRIAKLLDCVVLWNSIWSIVLYISFGMHALVTMELAIKILYELGLDLYSKAVTDKQIKSSVRQRLLKFDL